MNEPNNERQHMVDHTLLTFHCGGAMEKKSNSFDDAWGSFDESLPAAADIVGYIKADLERFIGDKPSIVGHVIAGHPAHDPATCWWCQNLKATRALERSGMEFSVKHG